jgi:4-hydroxybenzoate polyprenyltransferase
MALSLQATLGLVRFSHTIFALPFALVATLLALAESTTAPAPRDDSAHWLRAVIGILVCMAAARTAAMAFNRLVDRDFDAANPRTAGRHLPAGAMRVREVRAVVMAAAAAFVAGTLLFWPNWLPLALSLPVLAWLLGYSYAKRFTALAHLWLGLALGLAPLAAWIAIRGEAVLAAPADILPAAVLAAAVTAWVAGFDIIYACQDAGFDRSAGLYSVPARLGVPRALGLSACLHGLTVIVLACLPALVPALGGIYWLALALIAALLVWQHAIVRPDDLSRVNQAFFQANAAIGLVLLAAVGLDLIA